MTQLARLEKLEASMTETTAPKFKIGDIVRLASGGPLMTVWEMHQDNNPSHIYYVEWFVSGLLQRDVFSEAELVTEIDLITDG